MTAVEIIAQARKSAAEAKRQYMAAMMGSYRFLGSTVYVTTIGNTYCVPEDGIPPSTVFMKTRWRGSWFLAESRRVCIRSLKASWRT
jgi:hypothetical protein